MRFSDALNSIKHRASGAPLDFENGVLVARPHPCENAQPPVKFRHRAPDTVLHLILDNVIAIARKLESPSWHDPKP